MKKTYLTIFLVLSIFLFSACGSNNKDDQARRSAIADGQPVLQGTLTIASQYLDLRLRTDQILTQASGYADYDEWQSDLNIIINDWAVLEADAKELEELADKYSQDKKISLLDGVWKLNGAQAVSTQEINDVFDKAPAGKKIKTLASYLGVDAQRANAILRQAQDQVQADAWNEAGDTFQKLETSAVVIKDTCKVVGFVGGVVITGGAAGLAAAGTATKVAVVVSGADLVLEVGQDAATIALGNNNQVSEFIADTRVLTEPAAAILSITTIPQNIGTGFDKFNAAMLALDQFNSAAQDGKVVGIALPAYKKEGQINKAQGATMSEAEIDEWLAGLGFKRTEKGSFAVIEEAQKRIAEVKKAQDRINTSIAEQGELELEENDYSEENTNQASSEEAFQEEVIQTTNSATGESGVRISIVSPEGVEFSKSQARMWKLDIQGFNPGPGASKVCHWTFYLNGVKYKEMPDNKGCAFTSTFIDQKGSLKAEVRIDFLQGRSVFDDDGKFVEYVQDVYESLTTSRDYQVK